jgi:NAD(P)-dependent dehydrogenase (short-subunit alcohol dehydrogenase family)
MGEKSAGHIVIIGGTDGLGLSAAQALIKSGSTVVAVGRKDETVSHAQKVLGNRAVVLKADATDEGTAESAIEHSINEFGGFTGLYHVAGGSGRSFGDGPLHDLTLAGWNKTMEINLTGLMLSNRAAVRSFLARKIGGTILNMGSVLGYAPSPKYFTTHAYAAAKSAVIGFTKSIAAAYAKDNVRINVVAPALVQTPMSQRAAGNQEILNFIKTKQPLDGGRIGRPEDLDELVVYLLSDASKFITGQVFSVDGGWSVTEGQYV